jgi:hypothetical protein
MTVSAILNFRVVDAVAYEYSCRDPRSYIFNQGLEVLRRVAGMFPYRARPGSDDPSLMSDGKLIGACMT